MIRKGDHMFDEETSEWKEISILMLTCYSAIKHGAVKSSNDRDV